MALQDYKCPCCAGAIEFNSSVQKMKCPYCDTEFEMEALKAFDLKLDEEQDNTEWEKSAGSEWAEGESENINTYHCASCGGDIIADENTAASSCPYCGNPVVMMNKLSGSLKPDAVIPFKLDKEAAKAALSKHLEGKKLLPKVFKSQNTIDSITGIYVPFWMFDTDVNADIRYKATKERKWSDENFDYTETSYYGINRAGDIRFEGVPVDGSSKMADDLMESIEPFNMAEAVDFQTAYLAGYLADKYDVDAESSVPRANERIKNSTIDAFRNTVKGYDSVNTEKCNVRYSNGVSKYVLCPVWILNTNWNGEKYTFAMNGQTGKFVGNLPADKSLLWKYFAGVGAGVSAIAFIISLFLG